MIIIIIIIQYSKLIHCNIVAQTMITSSRS